MSITYWKDDSTMQSQAFIFSGQGTQYWGMGQKLLKESTTGKKYLDLANQVLDFDLNDILFGTDKNLINQTRYTQPALVTLEVAQYFELLDRVDLNPVVMAGHSLGEYAALVCSNAVSFEEVIQLVAIRGTLMERSSNLEGIMVSIREMDTEVLKKIIDHASESGKKVCLSNLNGIQNNVISGFAPDVKEVVEIIEKHGGVGLYLNVKNAFHSPLMKDANFEFQKELEKIQFRKPTIDLLSNSDGLPYKNGSDIENKLSLQMINPVDWVSTCQYICNSGADMVIEVGAKSQLKKMFLKDFPDTPVYSLDDIDDAQDIKKKLDEQGNEWQNQTEYSFIGRVLGVIASTQNRNWDNEEYEQEVIKPYKNFVQASQENEEINDQEDVLTIIKQLKRILDVKKVPVEEQVERVEELLIKSNFQGFANAVLAEVYDY